MFDTGDAAAQSLEFKFLINRALAARQEGRADVADVFVRAAERLLGVCAPNISNDVSMIASRKGVGVTVTERLCQRLSATTAAAVMIIWTLRGARTTAVRRLTEAFHGDEAFGHALTAFCPSLKL